MPYADLTPGAVLDALDAVGLRGDGRLIQLNSYENRVFQVFLEDGRVVVAKFYRPGALERRADPRGARLRRPSSRRTRSRSPRRWRSRSMPARRTRRASRSAGATLACLTTEAGGVYRFGVTERRAGRAPELEDREVLRWLGRYIGRHARGRRDARRSRIG